MKHATFVLFLCFVSYTLAAEYTSICPDGTEVVRCLTNPCDVAKCEAYPNAECRTNYCGECKAEFYVDGKLVKCDLCLDGSYPVSCFENPCDITRCEAYPDAECRPNNCGGCNAEFYFNRTFLSCSCEEGVSIVSCYDNPCNVQKCQAYPDAKCIANYCGGCNAEYYCNNKRVYCDLTDSDLLAFYKYYK